MPRHGSQEKSPEQEQEAEMKALASSPSSHFLKFDIELSRGTFKTLHKGLDMETYVKVAWCELQLISLYHIVAQENLDSGGVCCFSETCLLKD
ncbi:serine/threonine-protein kinase WNK3-like [Arapaima gigas]